MQDGRGSDGAAQDVRGQAAADDLDLGQLGHRGAGAQTDSGKAAASDS